MSTTLETAFPPLPDGTGNYRGAVLPIYGCNGNPECIAHCWLKGKSGTMLRQRLGRFCEDCKTMKPHVHWDRFNKLDRMRDSCVLSGHFCEIADLDYGDIWRIQFIIKGKPKHLFQIFTHRPMEFYANYPIWPKNTWCMGTFTQGEIAFPPELECGMRVAYVEPVLRKLHFVDPILSPRQYSQWLVIGLLNHAKYESLGITEEQLYHWIMDLICDARDLGIAIWCKNAKDPRWARMGIMPVQEWPK